MNSWKEYPQLFWKFICLSEVGGNKARHYVWWILSNDMIGFKENWIDSCTLIARKIEDMTDDELETFFVTNGCMNSLKFNEELTTKRNWLFAEIHKGEYWDKFQLNLYLLSIGVLPPIFNHQFETGEVIDIKTLRHWRGNE